MFSRRSSSSAGFTLIELLVVIAIIGLLSSVIMSSLNNARQKSRHAKRLQDMQTLMQALEMYASDNAGKYPSGCTSPYLLTSIESSLVPAYLPKLPHDPFFTGNNDYLYCAGDSDRKYMLLMRLEKPYNSQYWCRISSAANTGAWTAYPYCAEVQ